MFVLAHLSDPHLGPLPVPRARDLAGKRILGFINWHRGRGRAHRGGALAAIVADMLAQAPDHVAVTGDLVNIALPAEFPNAAAWLARLGPPDRVTFVPGNHDAYVRGALPLTAAHFGDHLRGDLDVAPGAFPFVRQRGPVVLIGVSSAVPSAPFMATGVVGAAQLERLSSLLAMLAGAFRVVLIHHPPVTVARGRHKRLRDAAAFAEVIARHGAELVLHGHLHEGMVHWLDGPLGPVPVVGVPSASAELGHRHPAAYNLYRVTGGPGAWRCEATVRGVTRGGEGVGVLARLPLDP